MEIIFIASLKALSYVIHQILLSKFQWLLTI
jgi:hypothetical protein